MSAVTLCVRHENAAHSGAVDEHVIRTAVGGARVFQVKVEKCKLDLAHVARVSLERVRATDRVVVVIRVVGLVVRHK